ncbi:MOP flippase family protein [Dickeya sp. CFBP 2040]|uniref:MOP flippase family protein n=1 Tax=Dickeya sp. CFBP 2040 TaxID=2718531 RepID=UPI001447C15A|nr:MOP flippase family protein [Dickeya sp. CFBP 2040]NKI73888.1 MOP flippase family protein [Dickeya sp. CFBP 2040]
MGILSNTTWVGCSQGFKILVQLLSMVILARLIPPDEYGIMGMAMVVVNLAVLVRDLGTSAAIIQRKELSDRTVNAVFWLNVSMGIFVAAFVMISSPVFAYIFHQERLVTILCLISLGFPLGSCSAAHLALLERQSKFKKVALIEISSSLLSFIVAIITAMLGYGVMSLVFQLLCMNLMSTVQLWLASNWRPSLHKIWDKEELKSIFGFSSNLTMFNLINYFSRNADSMIIGHYLSAAVLGAYTLAYRIMLFPTQSLTFVISRALFPILSQYQDDPEKIREVYYKIIYWILFFVMPLMLGLAVLNKEFIFLVFGEKWRLTADILVWLAPTAIIQAILNPSGTIFMSRGRTDILMFLGVFSTILQVSAFIVGFQYGIIVFSKFYFLSNAINFFPVLYFIRYVIHFSVLILIKKVMPIFISSLMMVLVVFFFSQYSISHLDMLYRLIFSVFIGVFIYGVMMFLVDAEVRHGVSRLSRRKFSKA